MYFLLFTFLIKKLNLHTPGREKDSELAAAEAEGETVAQQVTSQGANTTSGTDAAVVDLIRGLGGKDNIESLENCFTRLRVNVKDESLVNEDLINHMKNSGIMRKGKDIQIILGMQVAQVRGQVEEALEKM